MQHFSPPFATYLPTSCSIHLAGWRMSSHRTQHLPLVDCSTWSYRSQRPQLMVEAFSQNTCSVCCPCLQHCVQHFLSPIAASSRAARKTTTMLMLLEWDSLSRLSSIHAHLKLYVRALPGIRLLIGWIYQTSRMPLDRKQNVRSICWFRTH